MKPIKYPRGASLPDLPLVWRDRNGAPLLLSTATAPKLHIGRPEDPANVLVKENAADFFLTDTLPNFTATFDPGDLDFPAGSYLLTVYATVSGQVRMQSWPFILEPSV